MRISVFPSGAMLVLQREPLPKAIRPVSVSKPVPQPVLPVTSLSWRLRLDGRKPRPAIR